MAIKFAKPGWYKQTQDADGKPLLVRSKRQDWFAGSEQGCKYISPDNLHKYEVINNEQV